MEKEGSEDVNFEKQSSVVLVVGWCFLEMHTQIFKNTLLGSLPAVLISCADKSRQFLTALYGIAYCKGQATFEGDIRSLLYSRCLFPI